MIYINRAVISVATVENNFGKFDTLVRFSCRTVESARGYSAASILAHARFFGKEAVRRMLGVPPPVRRGHGLVGRAIAAKIMMPAALRHVGDVKAAGAFEA